MSVLLEWVNDPRQDRGLRFLNEVGGWDFHSYASLASFSGAVAGQLMDAGLGKGGVACIFLPTNPSLFSAIYGTWLAGGTVCPLVPPMMFEDEETYIQHVGVILASASPSVVVTDSNYLDLVEKVVRSIGLQTIVLRVDETASDVQGPRPHGEVALLQFTSGSSGLPRGVRVSFDNLNSNVEAIRRWIRMGTDDATATWLPLYHDMGLIGCLVTPTVNRSDVWIMRPDQFVREPLNWLECFGRFGATLCAAPNFGYAYAARKVAPGKLEGLDFANWRVAIAGAEPVDAGALAMFAEALAPHGFSQRAFLPAYGLAEATLAVTGGSPDVVARAVCLEWGDLGFAEPVHIKKVSELGSVSYSDSSGWLVGSGSTHSEIDVSIVDDDGKALGAEVLGEIVVRGPSVALGYQEGAQEGATRFSPRGLLTGDAGFLFDGELFVVGRMADSLKVRGRSIYSDDLEARLYAATEIRRGRCAVVAWPGEIGAAVLIIAEEVESSWADEAGMLVKAVVGESVRVLVALGPRGTLRRTSSGKPRRREMWELYRTGRLNSTVLREF